MIVRGLKLTGPRAASLICVGLLALTACSGNSGGSASRTTGTTSSPSAPTTSATSQPPTLAPTIAYTDCTDQARASLGGGGRAAQLQFSCGKINVPVDYSRPTGATLQLVLVKEHLMSQKASDRLGSLLINPGGPGASGIDLALGLTNELSDSIFEHFDIIGFDPRGVGLSDPVACVSDAQKDALTALNPDVRTAAGQQTARTAYAQVAIGCTAKYGSMLGHINTDETAQDMDRLRLAVGDRKLNYFGFSYGTRLGSVYAHEYPANVRVAVLDGAEDPVADELTLDEQQTKGFEGAFDQFAADCLKRPACAAMGNPRQVVEKLISAADATPIHSSKSGEKRVATGGIVTTAVASALYDADQWPTLGTAIIAAQKGDSAELFVLADSYNQRDANGQYTNLMEANLAVNCNDSTLVVTDALVQAKAVDWAKKYPIFGLSSAAALYSCKAWPKSGHPLPPATAASAPPILVIGTVHDPATPYAAAGVLAETLGSGVLLSWDGQGHTAYLKSKCVTSDVDQYLVTTKTPTSNSCPAS